MTATDLLRQIEASGARLVLLPSGRLKIAGDREQIERYLPVIGQYEAQLKQALRATADTAGREFFSPLRISATEQAEKLP